MERARRERDTLTVWSVERLRALLSAGAGEVAGRVQESVGRAGVDAVKLVLVGNGQDASSELDLGQSRESSPELSSGTRNVGGSHRSAGDGVDSVVVIRGSAGAARPCGSDL